MMLKWTKKKTYNANQEKKEKTHIEIKKITKHIVERLCCKKDAITKHIVQRLSCKGDESLTCTEKLKQ